MALSYLELLFGRSDELKVLSYATGCLFLLLSVSMTFSLLITWRKYKLITRRSTMERWDRSYCLFSKLLVQIMLIGTPFCIALLICYTIVFFIDYDNGLNDLFYHVVDILEYLQIMLCML